MSSNLPALSSVRQPPPSGMEPQLGIERIISLALDMLREQATRDQAARALVRLGDAAVPALLHLLHDNDSNVRRSAAWALSRVKDRRAVGRLIRAANWTYACIRAVHEGQISPTHAVAKLVDGLIAGSPPTRAVAAVALGRLAAYDVIVYALPELLETLYDGAVLPRLAAIWALGQVADPCAVPHLADALYDRDAAVYEAAAAALRQIGTPDALTAVAAWRNSQPHR